MQCACIASLPFKLSHPCRPYIHEVEYARGFLSPGAYTLTYRSYRRKRTRRKMTTNKGQSLLITVSIMVGLVVTYVSYYYMHYANTNHRALPLLGFLGICLTLWGCYLWTSMKNRHWLFVLWGLLSPIGLLGIALLKDKSANATTKDDTSSGGEVK